MNGEAVFDPKRAHIVHTETGKIAVFDQDGHLYDGITLQQLELTKDTKENYAIVEGAPMSKVKTEGERLQDTLNTIRSSGAVDPDSMAKFEKMLLEIQSKQSGGSVTVEKKVTVTPPHKG